MNLKKFDNKKVKIIDNFNDEYEGICTYSNKEYNLHEFGINDEGLAILNVIFYKDNIKNVKKIDKYSNDYGKLEELISRYEDDVNEILSDEEVDYEQKKRLLKYLKDKEKNNQKKM